MITAMKIAVIIMDIVLHTIQAIHTALYIHNAIIITQVPLPLPLALVH